MVTAQPGEPRPGSETTHAPIPSDNGMEPGRVLPAASPRYVQASPSDLDEPSGELVAPPTEPLLNTEPLPVDAPFTERFEHMLATWSTQIAPSDDLNIIRWAYLYAAP